MLYWITNFIAAVTIFLICDYPRVAILSFVAGNIFREFVEFIKEKKSKN